MGVTLFFVRLLRFVSCGFLSLISQGLLAGFGSCGTSLKSINTTFGVDDFFFTSKVRVRCGF